MRALAASFWAVLEDQTVPSRSFRIIGNLKSSDHLFFYAKSFINNAEGSSDNYTKLRSTVAIEYQISPKIVDLIYDALYVNHSTSLLIKVYVIILRSFKLLDLRIWEKFV